MLNHFYLTSLFAAVKYNKNNQNLISVPILKIKFNLFKVLNFCLDTFKLLIFIHINTYYFNSKLKNINYLYYIQKIH